MTLSILPEFTREFYQRVSEGLEPGYSLIHKFGAGDITTTFLPITFDNTYKTPTTATALEFLSDSGDDTSGGSGAREITIIGLNDSWEEVTQILVTDGATPVALATDLTRLYRWYVSQSGTYATELAGSHAGTMTIRVSGGGATWGTIGISPFPAGQSQIGVYSIPTGKTGYLLSKNVFTDTNKTADIYFFQRPLIDDVSSPFTGTMRLVEREVGVQGGYSLVTVAPKGPFVGPCDLGFMGKVSSGTAEVSVEFELLIIDN